MAKSTRTRRRIPSRQIRARAARPYKSKSSNRHGQRNMFTKDCAKCLEKRDYENVICSVCMECPHNAVLLLCSSHDKGCRPFMCGTSFRYSNCLDQYKKASAKLNSTSRQLNNKSDLGNLTCPLCRGQVKGWTIVELARGFLNLKKRICMQENCVFAGNFKELRKHMKMDHPCARPREVDPEVEQNWRRLEIEQDRDDVISTIMSMLPGSTVFGDYVIETNNSQGSGSEEGREHHAGFGRSLWSVIIMMHGALRIQTRHSDSDSNDLTTHRGTSERTVSGEEEDEEEVDTNSNSLASRMRRQGRVLLGRSGRRRRNREANQSTGPPR